MASVVHPPTDTDRQHVGAVHELLRSAILRGEIAAGEVTSQVALAQLLDVGRTPLREALRMLQREGLIVAQRNRRVQIAELSGDDAEELYVMRISLEAVAITITVPTLDSDALAELKGLMAQMDHYMNAGDQPGMRPAHRVFHHLLVSGAGPRVSEQIAELFDHGERYRLRYGSMEPWTQRRQEHQAILDAVVANDADLAAERLVAHYARTAALIFAVLEPTHDLGRLRATIRKLTPGAEYALGARA